jgi:PPOX class probable FMN-dependent enzyme
VPGIGTNAYGLGACDVGIGSYASTSGVPAPGRLRGVHAITTEAELRELLGEPAAAALAKERNRLHELDRAWLGVSPFCLVSTSGPDGSCDVSPNGDPPGFTLVLDDRTIALPERAGNRRADGYRNILANPHVGLLFVVPGRGDTLRINGRARLTRDPALLDGMVVRGHRPLLAMVVEIELERRGERLEDIERYYGEQYSAGLYPTS